MIDARDRWTGPRCALRHDSHVQLNPIHTHCISWNEHVYSPKNGRGKTENREFFTERIVNLWNTLPPDIVNFNSLSDFKRSIKLVNFSCFVKCFNHNVFFFPFMGIHKSCYPVWFVQFKCFMFYCYRCYCIIWTNKLTSTTTIGLYNRC